MKKIKLISLTLSLGALFALSGCTHLSGRLTGNIEKIPNTRCSIVTDTFTGKKGINFEFFNKLPCEYDSITAILLEHFKIEKNGKFGLCRLNHSNTGFRHTTVEILMPCKYDEISFDRRFFKVKKENKYGACNPDGGLILPCEYDNLYWRDGNLVVLEKDKKKGIYSFGEYPFSREAILLPCKYDDIRGYKNGHFVVKKDDKWGVVKVKGEIVVPCEYDDITTFEDGYAKVKKGNKWGAVNPKGEVVIAPEHSISEVDAMIAYRKFNH